MLNIRPFIAKKDIWNLINGLSHGYYIWREHYFQRIDITIYQSYYRCQKTTFYDDNTLCSNAFCRYHQISGDYIDFHQNQQIESLVLTAYPKRKHYEWHLNGRLARVSYDKLNCEWYSSGNLRKLVARYDKKYNITYYANNHIKELTRESMPGGERLFVEFNESQKIMNIKRKTAPDDLQIEYYPTGQIFRITTFREGNDRVTRVTYDVSGVMDRIDRYSFS